VSDHRRTQWIVLKHQYSDKGPDRVVTGVGCLARGDARSVSASFSGRLRAFAFGECILPIIPRTTSK
jgi:hypothetical protein